MGRRLPHRRPVAAEATGVHREVNKLIIHSAKKIATRQSAKDQFFRTLSPDDAMSCRFTVNPPTRHAFSPRLPVTKTL